MISAVLPVESPVVPLQISAVLPVESPVVPLRAGGRRKRAAAAGLARLCRFRFLSEETNNASTHAVSCAHKIANLDLKSAQRDFTNERYSVSSREQVGPGCVARGSRRLTAVLVR